MSCAPFQLGQEFWRIADRFTAAATPSLAMGKSEEIAALRL
jgi:hypothetical protein